MVGPQHEAERIQTYYADELREHLTDKLTNGEDDQTAEALRDKRDAEEENPGAAQSA